MGQSLPTNHRKQQLLSNIDNEQIDMVSECCLSIGNKIEYPQWFLHFRDTLIKHDT